MQRVWNKRKGRGEEERRGESREELRLCKGGSCEWKELRASPVLLSM
jgi:hypothetical protein